MKLLFRRQFFKNVKFLQFCDSRLELAYLSRITANSMFSKSTTAYYLELIVPSLFCSFSITGITHGLNEKYTHEESKTIRDYYGVDFEYSITKYHGSSLLATILPTPVTTLDDLIDIRKSISIDLSEYYEKEIGVTYRSFKSMIGPNFRGQRISQFEYFFLKRLRDREFKSNINDKRTGIMSDISVFRKSEFKFLEQIQRIGVMHILPDSEHSHFEYPFIRVREKSFIDRIPPSQEVNNGGLITVISYNGGLTTGISFADQRLIMPKISHIQKLFLSKFCQKIQRIVRGFIVRRNKEAFVKKAKLIRMQDEKRSKQMQTQFIRKKKTPNATKKRENRETTRSKLKPEIILLIKDVE